MKLTTARATALIALCLLLVTAAQAAIYYVSQAGDDDAAGIDLHSAWRTVQRSVQSVAPGDTVILTDGVYREMVRLDGIAKGEKAITYRAEHPRQAIIDPEGSSYCVGADWDKMQNLVLVGLRLQNAGMGLGFEHGGTGMVFSNCEISGCKEAIRVNGGDFLSILDCSAHDNANGVLVGKKDVAGTRGVLIERCTSGPGSAGNRDGFVVEGMSTDVVLRDCMAFGAGDSGFDIKPGKTLLERCRSYGNGSWGFKLWGSGCKLINCITYGNRTGGMGCAGDNLQFWNCTFGADGASGLRLETPNVATCVIRNSIFYGSVLHCYASGLPDEDYNCYYSPAGHDVIQTASRAYQMHDVNERSSGLGAHDRANDPLFLNPQKADFGLSKTSPCLRSGASSSLVAVDYFSKPRRDPPDLGAIASP